MLFRNCTISDLQKALDEVNKKYENNIIFNRLDARGFTLRCKDSKKAGHRLGYYVHHKTGNRSRLVSACWHVHGDFFDALFGINPDAVIVARKNKITKESGNWEDCNIGSMMFPFYFSEACECQRDL